MTSVTVVSCVYGGYDRFIPKWEESLRHLEREPECVIRWSDPYNARLAWRHPQAFLLQQAISEAETEWVWILDIDDLALPDALNGIDDVQVDVWQMGYHRSDGETYVPPQLTADEYLAQSGNPFVGSSAFRTEAFHAAGGFPDVAFQDWGLWRRMARNGATFESSGRAHFRYQLHPLARSTVELVSGRRPYHLAEMLESESVAVA